MNDPVFCFPLGVWRLQMCVVCYERDDCFHGELRALHVQFTALYFPVCHFPVSVLCVRQHSPSVDGGTAVG